MRWHQKNINEVIEELNSSLQGLSSEEAERRLGEYGLNELKEKANVLIFPNLESGNIAYKLMSRLGGAEAIGPILMGVSKSIHVLQRNCDVNDIVNMTAIAVTDAQKI